MRALIRVLLPACLFAAVPVSVFEVVSAPPVPSAVTPVAARPPSSPVLELPPAVGAGADWWARASDAIARAEYEATPAEEGFRAPNRKQNLRTWYRYDGVEVFPHLKRGGDEWVWKFRTLAWGRPGSMHPARAVAPRASGARVEYRREGMVEWYENGPDGLEQGFTLAVRPTGAGPLRVLGRVSNQLRAREAGADEVSYADPSGTRVLRYGDLVVRDARGQKLEAHLEAGEGSLAIVVDDRAATYPITIDPLLSTAAWTAEGTQVDAHFGYSVASAGDVNGDGYSDVIVGAPSFDNGQHDEGRAFVFHGSSHGLSPIYAWSVESGQDSAQFGYSVASAGDVNRDGYSDVIVGACTYDGGEKDEGRAYVYLGSAEGLATSPAWTAECDQAYAYFGASVACAGDVNKDGYSDVMVGAYAYDGGQGEEGRAFVYYGSAAGLPASPSWTAECDQEAAEFGYSVASAGDVNLDGYSDVIIGARWFHNGQNYEGRAFVYHGSASGLAASPAWTAEGNQMNALFGSSVACAGDVNRDGYADVVVGAPLYSGGQTEEGRAYVYHGSASGLAANPAWVAESDQAGARYGGSVATAGDVNGDGYADVIIGAFGLDDGQVDEGRAYVYYGSATGLRPGPAWTAESDQTGALFGYSVAGAGDVNGDGFGDVIVGAYRFGNGQAGEGRASVFHGASNGLAVAGAWTAETNQAHSHMGFSVASAGDVNGDGYGDVIVGAPWYDNGEFDEGRAFVYHGSPAGLVPAAAWTAECNQDSALFAYSVASAGDVNGDGYSDVIVGAYQYDNGERDEGRAYLYLGSPAGLSLAPAWTAESNQVDARFGYSVAPAGDVNGDGFGDVIIGAHRYDNGQIDEGRAYVYLGSAAGLGASPAWSAEGNQGGANFGSSVAGAGDVNGDGYADVIVGAHRYDHGEINEGRAYVFHGSASGLGSTPAWTAESDQADAFFGFSVASAGDVNGDGYSDVIVGAYLYDHGEIDEGRAYVYHGSVAGLGASPAWTAESDQASACFGYSVASAGDINHDGYSEVVVGAYAYDHGETDEGRASIFRGSHYGLTLYPTWTAESNQASSYVGWSVAPAGDINRDGFADLIVGAQKFDAGQDNEGRVYVYWDLRTSGSTTAVVPDPAPAGSGLRFALVYPNPSHAQSVLGYVLPRSGPVRLSIHDLLGRRIAVLADRVEEAGVHSVSWEGRDARGAAVPAGVYWARLESGGETAARKLVRR